MHSALQTHFLNLYSIALADLEFDETEIAKLYEIATSKGIPKEEIDFVILNPATYKFTVPETLSDKVEFLYDYALMILADGKVEEAEQKLLEKFCLRFEFEEKNIPSITNFLIEAAKNNVDKKQLIEFVTQTN